jgi:hypothetical protein
MPCVRVVDPISLQESEGGSGYEPPMSQHLTQPTGESSDSPYNNGQPYVTAQPQKMIEEGALKICLRKYYTTWLLKPFIKAIVVCTLYQTLYFYSALPDCID